MLVVVEAGVDISATVSSVEVQIGELSQIVILVG
jgi:hypothetical protein